MKIAAVIPARMHSRRLPGKPLLTIAGVPMILRVIERATACDALTRVIVATDSEEIRATVLKAGCEACMTSPLHKTGSDRVAEVASGLSEELILNLQGDEPLVPVSTLNALAAFGREFPDLTVATPMVPLRSEADIINPNIVKVVAARDGRALYFSRYAIPYVKPPANGGHAAMPAGAAPPHFKHVGIYLFRREFLLRFVSLPPTPLELSESLEQLRVLEHGYPVYMVPVAEDSISVDTEEDLLVAEKLIREAQGTGLPAGSGGRG
jgi:3-deoxy-manno-octulosonate cytidylyltransferase (CMP-KDO synthetase)